MKVATYSALWQWNKILCKRTTTGSLFSTVFHIKRCNSVKFNISLTLSLTSDFTKLYLTPPLQHRDSTPGLLSLYLKGALKNWRWDERERSKIQQNTLTITEIFKWQFWSNKRTVITACAGQLWNTRWTLAERPICQYSLFKHAWIQIKLLTMWQ